MDIDEFRAQAHAFSDWMADYLASVAQYPVRSQVAPGEIAAKLSDLCPQRGESMDEIFADFRELIMPGITHWQHPSFFAYFTANSSPPSVLAEMLTATLGAQCMLWETSPAATELEQRTTAWLRDLLELPRGWTGCIQDSASGATLCALVAAIHKASGGTAATEGLSGSPPLVVYTSAEAHSSVEKAARIAGLGSRQVRKIAVLEDYSMDPAALSRAIEQDRLAGRVPACVVATLGTTGLGAMDPVEAIGQIARAADVHLHVDAAWAGSALMLPEVRETVSGLETVDSFVFNPHKWLLTNFDCSAFFMRDPLALVNALSLTPAYLESLSGGMPEYRDWSVALGRRFRALKLWFVLRSYGAEGLREFLRNHIRWAGDLARLIACTENFELTTQPSLALLSFRFAPPGVAGGEPLDRINETLVGRLNDSGKLYLTKTRARQGTVIRFMIGQTSTTWEHVESAWVTIKSEAQRLLRGYDEG